MAHKLILEVEKSKSESFSSLMPNFLAQWRKTSREVESPQIPFRVKHRINAGNKACNAKDETVGSIFNNKFCIRLDFEILESSLPFYQYGLGSQLTYELTFADYSDVIKILKF